MTNYIDASTPFAISSPDPDFDSAPVLSVLASGDVVAVWTARQDSGDEVVYRIFAADGTPLTGETAVAQTVVGSQTYPGVAALSGGGFVVTWTETGGRDGDSAGVFARSFDSEFAPVSDDVPVPQITAGYQGPSTVTGLADGGYSVVWSTPQPGSYYRDVVTRSFDADGTARTAETAVPINSAGDESSMQIAQLYGGGYVVVWLKYTTIEGAATSYQNRVSFQLYDDTGAAVGSETPVLLDALYDDPEDYHFTSFDVSGLSGGGFVIGGFYSLTDDAPSGTYQLTYTAGGAATGIASIEEPPATYDTSIALHISDFVGLSDGGWLRLQPYETFDSPSVEAQILAQRYDATGMAVDVPEDILPQAAQDERYSLVEQVLLGNGSVFAGFSATASDYSHWHSRGVQIAVDEIPAVPGLFLSDAPGAQDFTGGAGDDTVSYEDAGGRVIVDLGSDLSGRGFLRFFNSGVAEGDTWAGVENVIGGDFADNLRGDDGNNALSGGGVSDRLYGRDGDDTLDGGTGADALYGNLGADVMTGGPDAGRADRYIYFAAEESGVGAGNRDIVTDFVSGEDRIELGRIDADISQGFKQRFDFIGEDAFSAAGQIRYEQAGGVTLVQADRDGDGAADFEIELSGQVDLTAGDFLI